ncbi:MAG: DUF3316 domain-containing protein [Bacteroidaceae bacterium]|nr:DUF3316 domain-containing protein [Bacteroidaceae bacterium]
MKRDNRKTTRLPHLFLLLAMIWTSVTANAQSTEDFDLTSSQTTMHSMMVGAGWANVLESYLSPYNYRGTDITAIRETMRPTKMMQGRVHVQTLFQLNGSILDNKAKTAKEYAGGLRYGINWQYTWELAQGLKVMAGPGASAYLGGIYNDRNGNNPGQAKGDLMIDLNAQVFYNFRLFHREWMLRYEMTVPFCGMAYTPNYGQSYYEAFELENYDRNLQFAHFANTPSMRHLLTLSVPMKSAVIRVGLSANYQQQKLNGLKYHNYDTDIIVGFAKYFQRKATSKNHPLPF